MKIAGNTIDANDRGALDTANNRRIGPVDGARLSGAMLSGKASGGTTAHAEAAPFCTAVLSKIFRTFGHATTAPWD